MSVLKPAHSRIPVPPQFLLIILKQYVSWKNLYFLSDALNDIAETGVLNVWSARKTPPRASTRTLGGCGALHGPRLDLWGPAWICRV